MFRLKSQQPPLLETLPVRRLWTVGASASVALASYTLVGYCINSVAGASTLVGVTVSAVLALITGFAFVELTKRTRFTGSPYSFCYTYLGELPAFVVGWAVIGECYVGAALMGKTITYYISFLSGDLLLSALRSCCSLGGTEPKLWNFFDPVALGAILLVGGICAINSHRACQVNQVLLLLNFLTLLLTIVVTSIEGESSAWEKTTIDSLNNTETHSIFVPGEFGAHGVFQASAIYMHVFLSLTTTATLVTRTRSATASLAISMIVTLIVAFIAVAKATSVSLLDTFDKLDRFTPVATYMKKHELPWVATVNSLGAIAASLAGIISMLVLSSNTLEQMASDNLLWGRLASKHPAVSPTVSTIINTGLSALVTMFHDMEGLILSLSSGTFLVFQALLIAVMVSRSHASRETALLIVLKFTWLLYFFVTPAIIIITHAFAGNKAVLSAMQGLLSGIVLMFLQLAINRGQLGMKVVAVQVGTSVVMGFSSYLMYQLHEWAWYRLFIWTFIGALIYFLYGYRASRLGRGIVDLDVVPHDECMRSLERGLDNPGFQHELAQMGVAWGRRTQRSIGGHSYASARSQQRDSFSSAREDELYRQSFKSIKESESRQRSFRSARGSEKSSRGNRRDSFVSIEDEHFTDGEDARDKQRNSTTPGGHSQPNNIRRSGKRMNDKIPHEPERTPPSLPKHTSHDRNNSSFRSFQESEVTPQGSTRQGARATRHTSELPIDSGDDNSSGKDDESITSTASEWSPSVTSSTNMEPLESEAKRKRRESPRTSRPATHADLARTPPSSHKVAAAEPIPTTRTSPKTVDVVALSSAPRRKQNTEMLIDPRKLYEEIYPNLVSDGTKPSNSAGLHQASSGRNALNAKVDSEEVHRKERLPHDSTAQRTTQSRSHGHKQRLDWNIEPDDLGRSGKRGNESELEQQRSITPTISEDLANRPETASASNALGYQIKENVARMPETSHTETKPLPESSSWVDGSLSISDISYDTDEEGPALSKNVEHRRVSDDDISQTTKSDNFSQDDNLNQEESEILQHHGEHVEEDEAGYSTGDIAASSFGSRHESDSDLSESDASCSSQIASKSDPLTRQAIDYTTRTRTRTEQKADIPTKGKNQPLILVAQELTRTSFDSETSLEQLSDPENEKVSCSEEKAKVSCTEENEKVSCPEENEKVSRSEQEEKVSCSDEASGPVSPQESRSSRSGSTSSGSTSSEESGKDDGDNEPREESMEYDEDEEGEHDSDGDKSVTSSDLYASSESEVGSDDVNEANVRSNKEESPDQSPEFLDSTSEKSFSRCEDQGQGNAEDVSSSTQHVRVPRSEEDCVFTQAATVDLSTVPRIIPTSEALVMDAIATDDDASSGDGDNARITKPASLGSPVEACFSPTVEATADNDRTPAVVAEKNCEPGTARPVVRRQMRLPSVPTEEQCMLHTVSPLILPAPESVGHRDSVQLEKHRGHITSSSSDDDIIATETSESKKSKGGEAGDEYSRHPKGSNNDEAFVATDIFTGTPSRTQQEEKYGVNTAEKEAYNGHFPEVANANEHESPVLLRKSKSAPLNAAQPIPYSLPPAESRPVRPAVHKFGSLPPLNPTYRSIYRHSPEAQFSPVEHQARDTMIRDSLMERASSFEVDSPLAKKRGLNSSDLKVMPEIDGVLRRLTTKGAEVKIKPVRVSSAVQGASHGASRSTPAPISDDDSEV